MPAALHPSLFLTLSVCLPLCLPPSLQADPSWLSRVTAAWQRGLLSNLDYLLFLNLASGRTFNDLSQYPVGWWVGGGWEGGTGRGGGSEGISNGDRKRGREKGRERGLGDEGARREERKQAEGYRLPDRLQHAVCSSSPVLSGVNEGGLRVRGCRHPSYSLFACPAPCTQLLCFSPLSSR